MKSKKVFEPVTKFYLYGKTPIALTTCGAELVESIAFAPIHAGGWSDSVRWYSLVHWGDSPSDEGGREISVEQFRAAVLGLIERFKLPPAPNLRELERVTGGV